MASLTYLLVGKLIGDKAQLGWLIFVQPGLSSFLLTLFS